MATRCRRLVARAWALFTGETLDRDFQHEMDAHLSMLIDEYVGGGMTRDEAARAARLRFGAQESLKAQHRDTRGFPALEHLWQDIRFALRLTLKERWFSLAAVSALAIGIGANATGFSIISAAFVRGLPFENSSRIVEVQWRTSNGRSSVSHADLLQWRSAAHTVQLAGFDETSMSISDEVALPEQIQGAWVTANLFGTLRQQLAMGRDFVAGEDQPGARPVVIIGHRVWKTRYGGRLDVLGQAIKLDGQPATVVGVMPEGMKFPEVAEVWAPLVPPADQPNTYVTAIGRLRDDVDLREAAAELTTIARQGATTRMADARSVGVLIERYGIGGYSTTMFPTIMVAVGLVLLIACANVANLLLSRSVFRVREMALRIAMGATRLRVIRQLIVESVILTVLGGVAGTLLAVVSVDAFERALVVSDKPYWLVFSVDWYVLAYVAGLCLLTAVVFGLVPALHISQTNSHEILKDGARGATLGPRLRGFSSSMVVLELALTVVLLAGAGLLIRSFARLYSVDLGIETDRLISLRTDLSDDQYATPEMRWQFFERLRTRVASLPGVDGAVVTTGVPPLDGGERLMEVERAGGPSAPRFVSTVAITPQFFAVVDRPVVRGRGFSEADGAPGYEHVIINEGLAETFFAGEDPIGRRIRFTQRTARPDQRPEAWRTIVGVSPSIRHGSSIDGYESFVVYVPYRQQPTASASLLVRSALAPESVMEGVRRELREEDPDQPVYGLQTVAQALERDRWPYRIFGTMFAVLAIASLVLSAVGMYAVMAYAVSRRTHEIGVRIAVGANHGAVLWLVFRRGLRQVAAGLAIGVIGAMLLGVALEGMLVNLSPADPPTLAAVTVALTSVALLACAVPARRAMRVDPVVALRSE